MRWRLFFLLASCLSLAGCNPFAKAPNAGIQVITSSIPSAVFLEGQHLNTTPLIERNIAPGQYSLRIVPDDDSYVPYETSVTLRSGLLTVVTWKPSTRPELSGGVIYEMEPLTQKEQSEVSFVTIPDAAIVSFADKEREFSPTVFTQVAPGQYEFEITLPSYETQKHTINVLPGHRMLVRAKLAKAEPSDAPKTLLQPPVSPEPDDSDLLEETATKSAVSTPSSRSAAASAAAAVSTTQ